MNVALPERLKAFVLEQVAVRGYASVSEYVRSLIRAAQREAAEMELEGLLLAGIESGEPTAWEPADRERLEQGARERQAAGTKGP